MRLTRREFSRMGAAGMAAAGLGLSPKWAGAQAGGDGRVGYAMIGLGEIAKHFGGGVQMSQHSRITGLVSGHRDKALEWAKQYGVAEDSVYSYEDMDRMRDNKAIQAVYVALPNSMHAEYTERSAKAGKHVLCEKPMATSVADSQRMIDACRAAQVKLMIAYRLHYEPLTLEIIKRLRSGEFGKIVSIESAQGFDSRPDVWRLNRKLAGGGPLLDVGIYALNATRYLTGEEPVEFKAMSYTDKSDPRFAEVEETVTWLTRFPSGVLATCATTYGGNMPDFFKLTGTKGVIEMEPAFVYQGLTVKFSKPGVPPEVKSNPEKDPMQFMREADYFSQCVQSGQEPTSSGEEGLRDMRYMSQIYQAAGLPGL